MGETPRAVTVVKSSMVVPDVETPKHRLWLSNLDQMTMSYHTSTFYIYRSNSEAPFTGFFSMEKLKASLSKALVAFYPMAGRLVTGGDWRVEIDCNGEGVLFLEAESDCTLDELGDLLPSMELKQMLVPWAPSSDPPCVLVLLQVTCFKCGGFSLGTAIHHAAADGPAALHFINTWAAISRGVDDILPPFLDRGLLRARSTPKVLFQHPEYRPKKTVPGLPKPFSTAVLHLSKEQLAALKSSTQLVSLSTFKAVVAHVWRCVCKAAPGVTGDEESRLLMPADARSRLNPPLPPGYLGTAIFRTSMTARVGDVLSEPLERTGNRIVEATSRLGDEYVRSVVDLLELQGDLRSLATASLGLQATDLWVVSWLGMPIYDADFGWGRPALMLPASLPIGGMVFIMHRPGKDGVSVALSLEQNHMLAFQKAFYHGLSTVEEQ